MTPVALTKEFRDLGPVPIARRKVIAALGGTAAAWPLTKYQSVGNPADLQNRVDQLKEQGEKVAVLLVSNADAETRFVALSLQ
jgi:hypothetical protein